MKDMYVDVCVFIHIQTYTFMRIYVYTYIQYAHMYILNVYLYRPRMQTSHSGREARRRRNSLLILSPGFVFILFRA